MNANSRIDELIITYLTGEIGEADLQELERSLAADAKARKRFAQLCEQDIVLRDVFALTRAGGDRDTAPSERQRRSRGGAATASRWAARYAIVAAAVLLVLGLGLLFKPRSHRPSQRVTGGTATAKPRRDKAPQFGPAEVSRPAAARQLKKSRVRGAGRLQTLDPGHWTRPIPPLPAAPRTAPSGKTVASAPEAGGSKPAPAFSPASEMTRTERPLARVARVQGLVMFRRGGGARWVRAMEGTRLLSGDQLDTRTGMARFELDGGAAVYANRRTLLRVLSADARAGDPREALPGKTVLIDLVRGEIYVEGVTSRESGVASRQERAAGLETRDARLVTPSLHVETPDSLISPVGTRFDVKRLPSATVVVVAEGLVDVRAKLPRGRERQPPAAGAAEKAGAHRRHTAFLAQVVRVGAGHRTRVVRGAAPTAPVAIDAARVVAWAQAGALAPEPAAAELELKKPAVVSFTLIDADTNRPIAGFDPLPDGAVLRLSALRTRNLNIRANTSPRKVGSVVFRLRPDPGLERTVQNNPPYTLAGNNRRGVPEKWVPAAGLNVLTATPFAQPAARGAAGRAFTITFRIVEEREGK